MSWDYLPVILAVKPCNRYWISLLKIPFLASNGVSSSIFLFLFFFSVILNCARQDDRMSG